MSIGTKSSRRRRDGDMTPFSQPLPSLPCSALLGLGFCFYGSWISTKAQEGGHNTRHLGMGTQNILENPKMHLQYTLSQSYVGLERSQ